MKLAEHPTASLGSNPAQTDMFCKYVSSWEFHILRKKKKKKAHCAPGHIKENATPKAQKVFCTTFLSFPQADRLSLQTVRKKTYISSGLRLQSCCLCNSPGYNSGCTQQRRQPQNSFMRQIGANSQNMDHMQRGARVCVWMQTNANNTKLRTVYWISACVWEKGDLGREPAASWIICIFPCLSSLAW